MNELALHILDIVQNSIRAKAKLIHIHIVENSKTNEYKISIEDDGNGMETEELNRVTSPFYTSRTTRKVGLGIPLLQHTAEQTGGAFQIHSEKEKGTHLHVTFTKDHIDRPILGDIASTLLIAASSENNSDLVYRHETENGTYVFDTRDVKKQLEGTPISTPEIRHFLLEMIRQNLEQIQISE